MIPARADKKSARFFLRLRSGFLLRDALFFVNIYHTKTYHLCNF